MQTRAFAGDVRFSSYAGGVIDDPDLCALDTTNHVVVMMAYVERIPSLGSYFKLRNSWGDDWGDDGYFRIAEGCAMGMHRWKGT